MRGIFIDLSDLQKINGVGYHMAKKEMRTLRDIIGKKKITIREYCKIEGITLDDFYTCVKSDN